MPTKQELERTFAGRHLPTCYDKDLPLRQCICGGPEREIFLSVLLEEDAEGETARG